MTNRLKNILQMYAKEDQNSTDSSDSNWVHFSNFNFKSYESFEAWCLYVNENFGCSIVAKPFYRAAEYRKISEFKEKMRYDQYFEKSKQDQRSIKLKLVEAFEAGDSFEASSTNNKDIIAFINLSVEEQACLIEIIDKIPSNHKIFKDHCIWKGYNDATSFIIPLIHVVKNKPFWINDLDSWKFNSKNALMLFKSLVNHLFVKYPINNVFYSMWFRPNVYSSIKGRSVADSVLTFINIAQGMSIKNAFASSNSFLMDLRKFSKKDFHKMTQYKEGGLHIDDFLRKVQIEKHTLDKIIIKEILKSRYRNVSNSDGLLFECATFVEKEAMFDRNQFMPLFDYIVHLKNEYTREDKKFVLKGRNINTLMDDMTTWHRSIGRDDRYPCWNGSGLVSFHHTVKDSRNEELIITYSIEEITTSEELRREGKALSHCVGSYAHSCYNGRSFIFSFTKEETFDRKKKVLTIELDSNHRVVQVRGKCNRAPTEKERNIVKMWANARGISYVR